MKFMELESSYKILGIPIMKKANLKEPAELKDLYKKDYVEKFSNSQAPYRLNRLLKYFQLALNLHVVDFACGNGMLLPCVAPNVASYVGVDFSEEFIRNADERKIHMGIKNAEFYCDDINSFCEKHMNSFDCAFAMDFSEHVYDEEWLEILRSIRKPLKREGRLYLHTPNSLFFIEKMKKHSFILKQFEEHIAVRSPEQNADLLKSAGYTIKKFLLLPHYNMLRYIHFISYAPFVGKYFKARIFIEATL